MQDIGMIDSDMQITKERKKWIFNVEIKKGNCKEFWKWQPLMATINVTSKEDWPAARQIARYQDKKSRYFAIKFHGGVRHNLQSWNPKINYSEMLVQIC